MAGSARTRTRARAGSSDYDVRADVAIDVVRQAIASRLPLLVAGSSFALVALLDALRDLDEPLLLPAGSRVMDTGGYKGRTRSVERADLLADVERLLGVDGTMVENEYGMCELSSQAYLGTIARAVAVPLEGADGPRWQPPWMRTTVVDPDSLEPVADGDPGVLVRVDLANAYTCAAVRTEDVGIRHGDSWQLVGRLAGAPARGC